MKEPMSFFIEHRNLANYMGGQGLKGSVPQNFHSEMQVEFLTCHLITTSSKDVTSL